MPNLIRQRAIEGLKVNDSLNTREHSPKRKLSTLVTSPETTTQSTMISVGLKPKGSKDSFVMA